MTSKTIPSEDGVGESGIGFGPVSERSYKVGYLYMCLLSISKSYKG